MKNSKKLEAELKERVAELTGRPTERINNLNAQQLWVLIQRELNNLAETEVDNEFMERELERIDLESVTESEVEEENEEFIEEEENEEEPEEKEIEERAYDEDSEDVLNYDDDFLANAEGDEEDEDEEGEVNENIGYDDFFGGKKEKGGEDLENNIFDIENNLLEDIYDDEKDRQIKEIEKSMMGPKKWTLKGEATAKDRQRDELLGEYVDFDTRMRPPPISDETLTETIEKMLKMRIKEDLFDDPVRKHAMEMNKAFEAEVDTAKSKKGLAEVYEDEFLKEKGESASETEINRAKKEIEIEIKSLFNNLDALSNGCAMPVEEMRVIKNVKNVNLAESNFYVHKSGEETNFDDRKAEFKTKEDMSREEKQTLHKKRKRNAASRSKSKKAFQKLKEAYGKVDSKYEAKMLVKKEKDKKLTEHIKTNELRSVNFFKNLQTQNKYVPKEERANVRQFKM